MDANEARRIIWAARPHIGAPMETTRDLAAVSRALELAEELIDERDALRVRVAGLERQHQAADMERAVIEARGVAT